jgi:hypothetical protein
MDDFKKKRKGLRDRKREAMEEEFKSSKERKGVINTFKKESRSIKRSEKNEIKRNLRDQFGI